MNNSICTLSAVGLIFLSGIACASASTSVNALDLAGGGLSGADGVTLSSSKASKYSEVDDDAKVNAVSNGGRGIDGTSSINAVSDSSNGIENLTQENATSSTGSGIVSDAGITATDTSDNAPNAVASGGKGISSVAKGDGIDVKYTLDDSDAPKELSTESALNNSGSKLENKGTYLN